MSIDNSDSEQLINFNKQVQDILESVLALADLNFDKKALLTGQCEQLDSLCAGINMLGEELRAKVVELNERETLIKEVHHRVKNNLQIVSSILSLQSNVTTDEFIISKLDNCQERIASMALVHEQLYNSRNLSELEINEYFGSLCQRMEKSICQERISLSFNGLDYSQFISSDSLIPIGLIVSELIMNAYKHAFPNDKKGVILIELSKQADKLIISVSDNGIGFENESLFHESQSLGLQLVHTLAEQISAKISCKGMNGTSIFMTLQIV